MFRIQDRHQLTKTWIGLVPGGDSHFGDITLVAEGEWILKVNNYIMCGENILIFTANILDIIE